MISYPTKMMEINDGSGSIIDKVRLHEETGLINIKGYS